MLSKRLTVTSPIVKDVKIASRPITQSLQPVTKNPVPVTENPVAISVTPAKSRGRPRKSDALTPAQKQRAYRERQRGQAKAKGGI